MSGGVGAKKGSWQIRAGGQWPECESPRREVAGGVDSGSFGLHLKGTLWVNRLLSFRIG